MDFGILNEIQVLKPWTPGLEAEVYWNTVEQAVAAEKAGFTHVWVVEHHFREEFSHSGAPEIWLSTVAQHTTTLRLGFGVTLLPVPFNHPVRVAERVAALDIFSRGRVELGTGRSVAQLELGGFDIDPGDSRPMWSEAVTFLQHAWTSGENPIEFDGDYIKLSGRKIFPRPVQSPHPPMWVAATSPPSYALAGDYGLGVLAFGMAIDRDAMGRRIAEWRHAMQTTTRTISAKNEQFALFMMCYCARTEKEAREMCEEAFVRYLDASVEQFIRWADTGELPPGYEWYAAAAELATQQSGKMKFDYLMENNMLLVGTPKQITSTIKSFEEVGVTQMLVATQLGRIPHQAVLESIRLFGDEVIPNFR